MIYRFADFELDEERRELRLQGRELLLQPRVFDVLAYLVGRSDRVVTKDELLDALWSDVIVGDGSVQRAISLARTALRNGDLEDAIRTLPRQGYRFCLEATVADRPEGDRPATLAGPLARARRAWSDCAWQSVTEAYLEADRDGVLATVDLERWAMALSSLGRGAAAPPLLERAVAAPSAAGDTRGAIRAAQLLAQICFEQNPTAVARGWHRRALALLAGRETSAEHGIA
ncbi:MAG: transcriptional regulator, partial [Thermoanaerobaculia bacterium]|nr:transcriptional regulator [Thermoanaerobaculia bacterium]